MQLKSKSGRTFILPSDEEEVEIKAGIASDPDTYELTEEELVCLEPAKQGRPKAESTKMPINIRLSPEVVNYFKGTGKGWQTRMNKVLEDYVAHH